MNIQIWMIKLGQTFKTKHLGMNIQFWMIKLSQTLKAKHLGRTLILCLNIQLHSIEFQLIIQFLTQTKTSW